MITVALREKMGLPVPAPAAARRGTGPATSSRLDRSTLLDRMRSDVPSERRLSIRFYKTSNVCQVGWGVYKSEQRRSGGRALSEQEIADNQERATLRAKANIKRDLLEISADHMLTLTYRENMADRKQGLEHLARFNRSMRSLYADWRSVSVMEFQTRGAVHFHCGYRGFYDVKMIRREWWAVVGDTEVTDEDGETRLQPNGNIDLKFYPQGGNACSKLAGYMAKYLGKELDAQRKSGEHRYFRFQVGEPNKEVYYIPDSAPIGEEREMAFEIIQTLLGRFGFVSGIWCSPAGIGSSGYMCGEST